jgi:hypothetical protein
MAARPSIAKAVHDKSDFFIRYPVFLRRLEPHKRGRQARDPISGAIRFPDNQRALMQQRCQLHRTADGAIASAGAAAPVASRDP